MFSNLAARAAKKVKFWGGDVDSDDEQAAAEAKSIDTVPKIDIHAGRNYTLVEDENSDKLSFYVMGCAGNASDQQRAVAKKMNDIAASEELKPSFTIMLGDNFYHHGVDKSNDPAFYANFYNIYRDKNLEEIRTVPFFVLPGNHDHDIDSHFGSIDGNVDFKKITAQIEHTYLGKDDQISEEKIDLYSQKKLDPKILQGWNMPARFYSLKLPNQQKELVILDSNTYVKDYVRAILLGKTNHKYNQVFWLHKSYHANKFDKLAFFHHPLYTVGKRKKHSDASNYLSAKDYAALEKAEFTIYRDEKRTKHVSYNQLLADVLKRQMIELQAVFAAHDHAMMYYLDLKKGLCQIIAGGGGGDLQHRYDFEDGKELPCYFKNNGFTKVTFDNNEPDLIIFDIYSTEDHHLQFTNKSPDPRFARVQSPEEIALREIVYDSRYTYVNIDKSWSLHGDEGNLRADNLMNIFIDYDFTMEEGLKALSYLIEGRSSKPDANSLVTIISDNLVRRFKLTLDELIKDPAIFSARVKNPPAQESKPMEIPKKKQEHEEVGMLTPSSYPSSFSIFGLKSPLQIIDSYKGKQAEVPEPAKAAAPARV